MSPLTSILVVQHQDDCPPAWFGTWIEEAGVALDVRRPYANGDALPADLSGHAGLLVLGGSMGADEHDRAPWLPAVKELVRAAVPAGVPTLGICLGHQVVASALGGIVTGNPGGTQRGVLDVGWTADAYADPLFGVRPPRAVHWNDDVVVVLPPGTRVLARAVAGEAQVLRFADHVWGIQSHPEVDGRVLQDWADDERGGQAGDPADGLDELLAAVAAEQDALLGAWQPVAATFARLCQAAGLTPRRSS